MGSASEGKQAVHRLALLACAVAVEAVTRELALRG